MLYREALTVLMKQRNMSPADLARAIGKSRSYVSQLQSGKVREPGLSLAFSIADALGVRLEDFRTLMALDYSGYKDFVHQPAGALRNIPLPQAGDNHEPGDYGTD